MTLQEIASVRHLDARQVDHDSNRVAGMEETGDRPQILVTASVNVTEVIRSGCGIEWLQ